MRKRLLYTLILVLALLLAVFPLARWLARMAGDTEEYSATNIVVPMLTMMEESPAYNADIAVEAMIDIEEAWAIEDLREETQNALVVGMRNGDAELGFDRESATFYCTLGMETAEQWPELALYGQAAQGAESLRIVWVDDYSYDFCADAISEGYRYELLAYTDEVYAYIGIVFTGLPIVTLHVHGGVDALGEDYVPARLAVSAEGYDAINMGAQAHLRGGGFVKEYNKYSYRIELYEVNGSGYEKTDVSLLGMPADSDWLLISNASDATCSRNELAWGMWRDWNEDGHAFMLQQSHMVEVFADDEYVGLYQLMQRIRVKDELEAMGGSTATDYVARIIKEVNVEKRPVLDLMERAGIWAELRYTPVRISDKVAFSQFEDYWQIIAVSEHELTDEAFAQRLARCTDQRELMEFFLFLQAASLGYDNVFNNIYIWAMWQGDHYEYHLSPWDMDMAFMEIFGGSNLNLYLKHAYRALSLDVDGVRDVMWEIWEEKRAGMISDDAIYQRIRNFEREINASGAYLRESLKWQGEKMQLDLTEICAYAVEHLSFVDGELEQNWPKQEAEETGATGDGQ